MARALDSMGGDAASMPAAYNSAHLREARACQTLELMAVGSFGARLLMAHVLCSHDGHVFFGSLLHNTEN